MYVVSYDIVKDRTRNKIAKELSNYGKRVQYSVFECKISDHQMNELYFKLTKLIQGEEGSIRIYHLCANCLKRLAIIGAEDEKEDSSLIVI